MFKTVTRIGLAGLLAVASLAQATEKAPESLRIGYQKGSVSMVLAKAMRCWRSVSRRPNSHGSSSLPDHRCWRR